MIAVGYVRRSKKSRKYKTISLVEQETQIRAFCSAKGWDLKEVVSHDGISGTKRTRFNNIETAIRSFKARHLVVYHLDRLSRDVAGLLDYLRHLASSGVEVCEVGSGQSVDLTTEAGFTLTAVKGVFDELFTITVSKKTKDALRNLRSDGKRYTNLPPFGYEYRDGQLLQNPEEQRALALLDRCRDLGLGPRPTIRFLESQGYRGRKSVSMIHRILRQAASAT